MSGTGKTRATRNGGLSQRRAWRVTLLSSGELPVADFIENAKGGQLVRLVDIEANDLFTGREDADAMKQGCANHYGLAGIEFLQGGNLLEGFDAMTADIIGDAPTPEAGRVRDRFRLVAHAGELAIRRGILPWHEGEVLEACQSVYAGWKSAGNAISEADRGIENVRNFILAFGDSRFEHNDDRKRDPIDRAGVVRDDIYHFIPTAFKEACGGVLVDTVKKELHRTGMLHTGEAGRYNSTARIDGKKVRVVSVKADILSDLEKTGGSTGSTGSTPYIPTVSAGTTTEPLLVPLVPPKPAGTTGTTPESLPVPPESYMPQGLEPPEPPEPLEPPKNTNFEKKQTVPGGLRI